MALGPVLASSCLCYYESHRIQASRIAALVTLHRRHLILDGEEIGKDVVHGSFVVGWVLESKTL